MVTMTHMSHSALSHMASHAYRGRAGDINNDMGLVGSQQGLVGNWKACMADEEPGCIL